MDHTEKSTEAVQNTERDDSLLAYRPFTRFKLPVYGAVTI
jgi:hypothetical protein